jgi:Heparinase II/III-like protein/Heparinase II/III N-terminus
MTAAALSAPVWCVTGTDYRDLGIGELAVAGWFDHLGVRLHLGHRPDWINDGLPSDEEWRIEWVKGYEGLHLAFAFAQTGDERFLRTWEDLVTSFAESVPVGHDASDVSARRLQNWLYSWHRFEAAPAFSGFRPGFEELLVDRIGRDTVHLRRHLTVERNHRTLELYTLLLVALSVGPLSLDPDPLAPDPLDAAAVLELLAENAATDIWADGVHRECSTDYHLIVLRSLVGAIANSRRRGLDIPPALLAAAGRAADFALHIQRPDGLTPAFSDGDRGDFRSFLADAARVLDRSDLAWVSSGGCLGSAPRIRGASFDVGGYYTQRSGWGETRAYRQERFGLFDCGPIGDGGHGHYDQLSVELYGAGRTLVVDPGRFTYADGPEGWRRWFKGTAAHNTVLVDGLDQVPYRRGKPKGPLPQARLVGRWTAPGVDVLVGESTSPQHDATHRRTLALVDDDHWVVRDDVAAPTPHRYQVRWHLDSWAEGDTRLSREAAHWVCHAAGLTVRVPTACGDARLEEGWVSPEYGVREPAPVLVVERTGDAACFVTEIYPEVVP